MLKQQFDGLNAPLAEDEAYLIMQAYQARLNAAHSLNTLAEELNADPVELAELAQKIRQPKARARKRLSGVRMAVAVIAGLSVTIGLNAVVALVAWNTGFKSAYYGPREISYPNVSDPYSASTLTNFELALGRGESEAAYAMVQPTTNSTIWSDQQATLRIAKDIVGPGMVPEKPDLALALKAATTSVNISNRQDVDALKTLARVQTKLGNTKEADKILEEAKKLPGWSFNERQNGSAEFAFNPASGR